MGFHKLATVLESEIDTLAYPVGARNTFSTETVDALRQGLYLAEPASSGATMPMGSSVAIAIAFAVG